MVIFWIVLSLTFIILEAATPGIFFFFSGALGALTSMVSAWLGYDFVIQATAFGVTALLFLVAIKYAIKYLPAFKTYHHQKTNIYALVGKRALVTQTIRVYKRGYVKIDGQSWAAESINGRDIEVGQEVEVVAVGGAHVKVKKINHALERNR